jgi:hypothetical protein
MLCTKTSRSMPRAVVEYVRYTSSPSRRNTLKRKPRPAPQSSENVPCDDTNGSVQPIRALYASIWASGMFDRVVQLTPRAPSSYFETRGGAPFPTSYPRSRPIAALRSSAVACT